MRRQIPIWVQDVRTRLFHDARCLKSEGRVMVRQPTTCNFSYLDKAWHVWAWGWSVFEKHTITWGMDRLALAWPSHSFLNLNYREVLRPRHTLSNVCMNVYYRKVYVVLCNLNIYIFVAYNITPCLVEATAPGVA